MGRKFRRGYLCILSIAACIITVFAGSASGAGFALVEQGVKGLGNAYAGGTASAEDATTIFFNPAGLTRLNGKQVVAGIHLIMPYANFDNEGSTHASGAPLRGDDDGNGADTRVIPNFYYSRKIFGFRYPAEVFKAILAGAIALILVLSAKPVLSEGIGMLPGFWEGDMPEIMSKFTKLAVFGTLFALAGIAYLLLLFLLKAFTEEDVGVFEAILRKGSVPGKWIEALSRFFRIGVEGKRLTF